MPSRIETAPIPPRKLQLRNPTPYIPAPSITSSTRPSSSLFSLSKWTRKTSASASASNAEIHTIAEESPVQHDLLCHICLRDLRRVEYTELECGHNFHSHCFKNVP